ncbi:MAG: YqgE/AlgH family protein [Pseudomonadota bacterium]
MQPSSDPHSLTGKFLIAMPGMGDPRFEHGVVYLCSHSQEGAMGLIVNKPAEDLSTGDVLEKLEIEIRATRPTGLVHFGGPVETGRGFVLHSVDYDGGDGTLHVEDGIAMTATIGVLNDIAKGQGPAQSLLALGYAGWGPGQLESELVQNGWLTVDATSEIIFQADNATKWTAALGLLGVDALTLSAEGGRA